MTRHFPTTLLALVATVSLAVTVPATAAGGCPHHDREGGGHQAGHGHTRGHGKGCMGGRGMGGPPGDDLRRGRDVFRQSCGSCHAHGFAGAPLVGRPAMWTARAEQGMDTLLANAVGGYRAMPPRGGNPALTNEQTRDAIRFMLWRSGVSVPEGG